MLPNPPSIPSHNNVFGYEENARGELIRQQNSEKVHAGDKEDKVGPGNYEIETRMATKGPTKWVMPADKPEKVVAIQREKKGAAPGPGHYASPGQPAMPLYQHNRSSVFASGVQRDSKSAAQKYRTAKKKAAQEKRRVMTTGGTHAKNGTYPSTRGVPAPYAPNGIQDVLESDSDSDCGPGPGEYYKASQSTSFNPGAKPERL